MIYIYIYIYIYVCVYMYSFKYSIYTELYGSLISGKYISLMRHNKLLHVQLWVCIRFGFVIIHENYITIYKNYIYI